VCNSKQATFSGRLNSVIVPDAGRLLDQRLPQVSWWQLRTFGSFAAKNWSTCTQRQSAKLLLRIILASAVAVVREFRTRSLAHRGLNFRLVAWTTIPGPGRKSTLTWMARRRGLPSQTTYRNIVIPGVLEGGVRDT
jgi:hypothetical protein